MNHLSREGTSDRETFGRFTALGNETVWPLSPHRAPHYNAEKKCTGRSESGDRGVRGWSPKQSSQYLVFRSCPFPKGGILRGKYPLRNQGDPLKRFECRETFDSSVSMGATCRVHAPKVTSDDDEPGAGECEYSLTECWVADIDWTHLDREPQQVARRAPGHDLACTKS